MKCASCGAEIALGSVVCDYCNSAAEASTLADRSTAEIFARIERSPECSRAALTMAKSALPAPNMLLMAIPVVFLIVWTGMAAFMGLMAMSHGAPAIFGLFAGGFVLIGFLGMGAVIKRGIRISTAEVEARPAILRGKRTHVSGGGESSTTTHYHATFEFKSGERQEFSVDWRLYGELAEDDAGILFSRAEIVEKFQRM